MMKLCLMPAHDYPLAPGLALHQDQAVRVKGSSSFFPCPLVNQDMVQISSFDLRNNQPNSVTKLFETQLIIDATPPINKPGAYLDTALLSFGIADKCIRHEKILNMSASYDIEKGELDISLLSELMGLQPLMFGVHQQPCASSLIYPSSKIDSRMPLPDFFEEMVNNSTIRVNSDGKVVLTASGTEMKDILSIVSEFYLSSNTTKSRNQLPLVPYFDRKRFSKARAGTNLSSLRSEVSSIAPLKCPEKIKLNPSPKKASKKLGRERDLYKKNYFHACECLLSLMVDKGQHGRTMILSLKKSGPELPQLLTQFSATIAGTGLALLFSVICKVACGKLPFCASKLSTTGLGFGLVWLSWAVIRLRDTVVDISKNNASKSDTNEEEMLKRMEKSVDQISFRAATLMAIALLRFA